MRGACSGGDLGADAEDEEHGPAVAVMNVSGRKMVAMIVSCFITALIRFETVERTSTGWFPTS
jgi:hypothetical protein